MEDAAARARHEATKAKLEAQFPIPKWYDISLPHVAPPSERPPALPMATSHLHANHRQHTANDALRSPARLHRRKIQTAAASPPKKPRLAPPLLQQTEAFGLCPPDVLLSSYDMEAMLRAPPVVDDRWAPLVEPQPKPSRKRSSVTRQALAKSGSSFLGNHGSILERHRSSHVWSHVSRSIDEIYQDTAALVASPHSSSPDPHDTIALDEAEGDVDDSLSDDKMVATPHEAEPSNNLTTTTAMPTRPTTRRPATELDSDRRIGTPGLRRRESIRKLVHFADGHLRKKIFRGWSTIEFAFSGGDLTQVQVEKVLTSHNICVTRLDLERVHATIDAVFAKSFRTNRSTISVDMPEEATPHLDVPDEPRGAAVEELNNNDCDTPIATDASMTTDASIATDTSITTDAVHVHVKDANSISSGVPHTVSYELMMDLFYPHDEAEAAQWLFEMELERQAQLQEEDMRKQKLLELETKIKRRLAESAQDMWRVIKMFDYMHTYWPSQAVAEATTQRFHDLLFETTKRKKHTLQWDAATESAAVVPHASPDEPSNDDSETVTLSSSSLVTKHSIGHVFKALLQCFARNKCLEDLELDQAAHVFHDIAATVLQKGAVRFLERRAIFDCPERQAFLAYKLTKRVFRTWRANVLECIGRRRLLLRKFVAWKYLMTCSKWYRELFRLCFWPLHVWKRWTQFVIISRAKAIFLKNVFHEYYLLRHTRAWHRFALKKRALYAELATRKQRRALATLRSIVDVWRPWAAYGQRVRKIWRKNGLTLHLHTKFYTTKLALYLWRYFTMLHRDMRRRQYVCLHGMLQRHRRKETLTDGVENDAVPLTRIMDSPMGHKIKHKTRLHDLCITTYIKYRKKDRLNTLAKALVFQRIGPIVFRILWLYKEKKKRSRLVSMFGVFNVVRHRFLCWLRFAMIKKQHVGLLRFPLVLPDEPSSRTVGRALQWRQDKEWRDQGLQEAACEAMALRDAIEALRVAREASHARFLRREDEIRDIKLAEQGIQDDEQGKTLQMTSQLHHYANQIIHTRVRKLYEVICRAFDIFEDQAREHLLKSTFRALRLPAMSKKMTLLCHRCQLRNWIRLAKR
ncbi:hypothetical protein SPRG_09042 [Saprolegnia parasitica CBS 223.65]|uniref:Uncharacterized protein n=1 Tax=Saprolegnia parasitica (strain CBS 223.65) TaxID=695850 RepID=A0A067C5H1_SAPPC|nr:hypothetical protein SPRG_09042 [Saprolegnia parasitica CBS 223.65]KDO25743.1 hypothetical protein SPRG_09042 [Saprolegnia parasitica CBS 223.65]|eukprot:XP_012203552.1 hypothetical protein SPRG_09042 [Saprolegnia parasitica CBS 223.65]